MANHRAIKGPHSRTAFRPSGTRGPEKGGRPVHRSARCWLYIVQPAAGSGPIPGAEHRRGSDQKVPTSRNRKVLSGWKSGVAVWRNSIDRLNT